MTRWQHWPKLAVYRLIELADGSRSARTIADMLSAEFEVEVTRNAVIGKAGRLGLDKPFTTRPENRRALPKPEPKPPAPEFTPQEVRFPDQCRWHDCTLTRQPGALLCGTHLAEVLRGRNTRQGMWEGLGSGGVSSLG